MFNFFPETSIELILPWTPSVNHYYGDRVVKKGGKDIVIKYITAKGKQYREQVKESITNAALHHCKKHFTDDVRLKIDIVISSPDRRKRDSSNLLKALEDALQHAGVFPDDYQLDVHVIYRNPAWIKKGGQIDVRLTKIEWPETKKEV